MKKALIIFTRIPIEGKTKTRLEPYYDKQECAEIHSCFLRDYEKILMDLGIDIFVFYHNDGNDSDLQILKSILSDDFVKLYVNQRGNDVGEKMENAISYVMNLGYENVLLIGADIPSLRKGDIEEAYRQLEKHDIVIAPTEDGGYYLIGMSKICEGIFHIDEYGNEKVLDKTIKKIENSTCTFALIRGNFDVDVAEDLMKYIDFAEENEKYKDTYTYDFIKKHQKVSVIIPVYNEMKLISNLLEQISILYRCHEIIIVDGGSSDGTHDYIEKYIENNHVKVTLIKSAKGRAYQMNEGAKRSSGEILFFLHSDSVLSTDYYGKMMEVLRNNDAACFKIRFDSEKFLMKCNGFFSNRRVKKKKIMFGDQGIMIYRKTFYEVGGFKEIPIMEDYQLSLDLKDKGKKVSVADASITTSSRRYPKKNIDILKTMYFMVKLRKMYIKGEDINKINDMYKDVR